MSQKALIPGKKLYFTKKSGTIDHMFRRFPPGFSGSCFSLVFLLCITGAAPAENGPSVAPARERTALAESFTAERLWVWQKRLNLQDWKIAIVMSRTGDLKPKTLGNIHWDADKKSAVIRVLDPTDYRLPLHDMLQDMEFTVVHELIHLELSSLPRSEASRRDEEHAVNQIADALLKLDRDR
jgi:hypothetical protein